VIARLAKLPPVRSVVTDGGYFHFCVAAKRIGDFAIN
jgi:hypothetical protein